MDKRLSLGFWSIPKKLLLLLLIVFLPASGIIVASGLIERERAIREAENRALLLVQSLAAQQEQITAGTKQMLSTLAQFPQVKRLGVAACAELFSKLKEEHPFYSFIGVTTPDGDIFASAPPFEPGTNLSDRQYVKDVISAHEFSSGEYSVGRVTNLQTFGFGYPVCDVNKNLIAILIACMRLDEYAHFLKEANLPEDSKVSIVDHKGTRMYRFPENTLIGPGTVVPEDAFLQLSDGPALGIFERTSEDGSYRVYAYKRLQLRENSSPYLYITVSYPKPKILKAANHEMLGYLSVLGALGILTMFVAWMSAHRFVIQPINQLVASTQLFAKGEMGTRTGLPHSPDEVGKLAKSFDDMASLLEMQQIVRKQAEEALRASEEKFRLLVENAPDAIFVQTEDYLAYANPAAVKLFGAASLDELARNFNIERVHPAHRDEVMKRHHLLTAEKKPVPNVERKYVRMDGSFVDVETSAVPIRYAGRNAALVFAHDISERKWAAKQREDLNRFNQLILDAVSDGIIGIDAEGDIIFANPSAEKMFGFELEEMLGNDLHELIHHSKPDGSICHRSKCPVLTALNSGKPSYAIEDFFWRKNVESFPAVFSRTPIVEAGVVIGVVVTFRDITERIKDEEIKSMLEAKLAQAQKLEAIGTLAGGIAHDFNNILTPIIGFTEMSLRHIPHPGPVRNGLEQVLRAGLRARDLVKQILTFSRPNQEGERFPLEIGVCVKEIMKLLRATLPATIEISQNLEQGSALADATQIHQLLMNLCVNAAYAMDDHGVLEVNLTRVDLSQSDMESLSLIGLKPGLHLKLTVSDSGCGMNEATVLRVFEPYFTTKEVGKGTGLGLSVVHGIVKRHEGAVSVQSVAGKGTTFSIYMPEIKAEEDSPSELANERADGAGKATILLIDDEQLIVELGTLILERLGYQVTSVTDSLEALEHFRENTGLFDLIITDYTMPKLSGTGLVKEVHRIRPDIPIILSTGFSEKVTPCTAKQPCVEHIMKPFVVEDLAELVRKMLAQNG